MKRRRVRGTYGVREIWEERRRERGGGRGRGREDDGGGERGREEERG